MRDRAASFFTCPALKVCDRSTNTAPMLPQFLFLESGWDHVMDNEDKKRHCCKDMGEKE